MGDTLAMETEGLTKVYGGGRTEVVALRDASMRVRRGEVVACSAPAVPANPPSSSLSG